MRIIGGHYRGKKLFTPETQNIRPTADRAREALFNILNSKLDNSWEDYNFLDIFSGTGAIGLEALSRGASSVTLIDKDIKLSAKNATLFPNEQSKIKVISASAESLPQPSAKYNLIFLDAPYNKGLSEKALEELVAKQYLADDFLCVIEIERNELINIPCYFELIDDRTYGLARFLFLTKA